MKMLYKISCYLRDKKKLLYSNIWNVLYVAGGMAAELDAAHREYEAIFSMYGKSKELLNKLEALDLKINPQTIKEETEKMEKAEKELRYMADGIIKKVIEKYKLKVEK